MKIAYLLLLLVPTALWAKNEISWEKVQIPYHYHFQKDIRQHKACPNPNKIIKETLAKNKIKNPQDIKVGDWMILPVCNGESTPYVSPGAEQSKANSDKIYGWEELATPRGYTLSEDLSANQQCAKIWTKQIYEFQKKNPGIANPNKIPAKKKIFVQRCYEIITSQAKPSAAVKPEEDKAIKEAINDYLIHEGTFDVYLGATNYGGDKLSHVVGLGVRGNILNDKGFELKVFNFGASAILLGELEIKESGNYKFQKTLTVGIAEYFLNETYPAVSGSTVYATVGMIARPSPRWVAEFEAGLTMSGTIGPVIQSNAMKRFGSVWVGGFVEARSLNNPLYSDRDNLILSGLKLSF